MHLSRTLTSVRNLHPKREGNSVGKGNNNRSNKEKKKPKKVKAKASATANSNTGKLPLKVGEKNVS